MFYLARTYEIVKNYTAAYGMYQHLAEVAKWDEERYHGRMMMAEVGKRLNQSWQERYSSAILILESVFDHRKGKKHFLRLLGKRYYCKLSKKNRNMYVLGESCFQGAKH